MPQTRSQLNFQGGKYELLFINIDKMFSKIKTKDKKIIEKKNTFFGQTFEKQIYKKQI